MMRKKHRHPETQPHLREAVNYQPDISAVENQQPNWIAGGALYFLLALIICAVLWASFAQIDRIVVASGKIVTTGQDIVVQPLVKSIIRSIDVGVGDIVKAGTTLVTLDPTFASADLTQLQQKLNTTQLQILMIKAELEGKPFVPPGNFQSDMIAVASKLFSGRISEYKSRLSSMDSAIQTIRVSIESLEQQIEDYNRQLDIVKEVESMRRQLYEMGYDSKMGMLLVENNLLSTHSQWIKAKFSLKELKENLKKTLIERETFVTNWQKETHKGLLEAIVTRDDLIQEIAKQQRMNELVTLTAPSDAVVLEIGKYSIGSVAREGDPILTLVPLNFPLEVDVSVDTTSVGYIRVSDPCRLKLDTFPFQKHGTIEGRIRTISEDTIQNAGAGGANNALQKPQTTYKVRIELGAVELNSVPADFRLIPGMTLTAEIKVGMRSVMSYFLYPLLRTLDESMREP